MADVNAPVAVVGAGPYGLSLAAHLRARGVTPLVFGRPMESWRSGAPPSMRLKSEGFASSLSDPRGEFTLAAFCRAQGLAYADINLPTPLQTFVAYGDAFQARYAPQLDSRLVQSIREHAQGYELQLEDGARVLARQCAIATGLTGFEQVPAALQGLSRQRFSHTCALSDYGVFRGRRVLVIGAGASATNAAGELLRCGAEPTILCRDERLRFYPGGQTRGWRDAILNPLSPIGPGWSKWAASRFPGLFRTLPAALRMRIVDGTLGPAPAWHVREEIEDKIAVLGGRRLISARETSDGVEVETSEPAGGRATRAFDYVIGGTGYRVDLDRLSFLSPALRARIARTGGAPLLSRSFESSVPGLYFLGVSAAYSFGPALRFVCGAEHAAPRVGAAIAARLARADTRAVDEASGVVARVGAARP